jgi:hypothetical protein
MSDQRDTVPAPPVPSINPTAVERKLSQYALLGGDHGLTFVGLEILDGRALRITPMLDEERAKAWLTLVRLSVTEGTMFPEFCVKGHLKETVGLCGTCLKGGG